ncbi:MAG: hypothetical protein FJZ01_07335 [Candidatus Sericytochromatia bacterium]|nr:hypothetical protein [Candidatus Tanganyikabacteria bacterium]
MVCAARVSALSGRPRADLLGLALAAAMGVAATQIVVLGLSSTLPPPAVTLSEGGTTDSPEPSCVGCHFETPGDEGTPGATGQAEFAHKRFAQAAGLRQGD